ncbi:unnamed protein product, partial [Fusarium graminearum]
MRYSYTVLAFAATALALPTAKPADDGSWHPGKYEGGNTGYDDGKWAPGKYEGGNTGYDDGQYHGDKAKRYDDGKWYPGKYEGGH